MFLDYVLCTNPTMLLIEQKNGSYQTTAIFLFLLNLLFLIAL